MRSRIAKQRQWGVSHFTDDAPSARGDGCRQNGRFVRGVSTRQSIQLRSRGPIRETRKIDYLQLSLATVRRYLDDPDRFDVVRSFVGPSLLLHQRRRNDVVWTPSRVRQSRIGDSQNERSSAYNLRKVAGKGRLEEQKEEYE